MEATTEDRQLFYDYFLAKDRKARIPREDFTRLVELGWIRRNTGFPMAGEILAAGWEELDRMIVKGRPT